MTSRNSIKRAIADGRKIKGFHLTFPAPGVIELMAIAGVDYIYLDGEHGAFDNRDLETACITAERHGLTVIARVPDPSPSTIVRFLDRGAKGIVVPHVDSLDDAKAVVDATYYGPIGNRSFGGNRSGYGPAIADVPSHMAEANEDVCLSIMIETRGALAVAGQIAALTGVDYMSYGMMDLAQSIGHHGNPSHPEVVAAVAAASNQIHAAGKLVREDFITVGWVNDILMRGAKAIFGTAI